MNTESNHKSNNHHHIQENYIDSVKKFYLGISKTRDELA